MRLFSQHELRGSRKRIKAALRQSAKLELAIAIGEVGKHKKAEPIGGRFIKCLENARIVLIARMPFEQCLAFFAAISPEVLVQEIHHGP